MKSGLLTLALLGASCTAYGQATTAYFGDLHVHTSYSLDSYIGMNRISPEEAYVFAKGGTVETTAGPVRLTKPLDFAAVTDHVEFMPEMAIALTPEHPKYNSELAVLFRNENKDPELARSLFMNYVIGRGRPENQAKLQEYCSPEEAPEVLKDAWARMNEITERHNDPGTFTTLHGFEWTSAPDRTNLHRNVIFRDANVPEVPVTARYDQDPESLWNALESYRNQGMTVLAIPHNSNASRGLMFAPQRFDGSPIDRAYAERRASFEPVVEIMQAKGNSEVFPGLANNDEFDDFEISEFIETTRGGRLGYVREGLKEGLRVHAELGANPFKFGLIGSTDTHNGTPGDTDETDFNGSHGMLDASAENRRTEVVAGWLPVRQSNPGGLTGVWANENTRNEIYDALERREVFGTSGSRIQIRFFGGWEFAKPAKTAAELIDAGYSEGVPMGSDLPPAQNPKSPEFLVWAMKDVDSAPLDRIQIIKGWYSGGEAHEKIYNVALSDGRSPSIDGSAPALNAEVNLTNGEYDKTKGSVELMARWTDPDFDPHAHAFYYARAIEIPSARWTTLDAIRSGQPLLDDVPATVRERAWSSPIWYTPQQHDSAE